MPRDPADGAAVVRGQKRLCVTQIAGYPAPMGQSNSVRDGAFADTSIWERCGVPSWAWELPELGLLIDDEAPSPEAVGVDYRELLRTACSLRCLERLWAGTEEDYIVFVAGQPRDVALTRERFRALHRWLNGVLTDEIGLEGMRYLMLVHDAGKCATIVQMAQDAGFTWNDHDELLRRVMENRGLQTALLPTFGVLDRGMQDVVLDVLTLECNLGQVMQGEAPAGVLVAWEGAGPRVRDWYLVHLLLDLAGVRAGDGKAGAMILTSPVMDEFDDLAKAMGSTEPVPAIARYSHYLRLRATALGLGERVAETDLVAVTRLALMLQVLDAAAAESVCAAWNGADPGTRAVLRSELGRDGTAVHAFLPYYAPAFMRMTAERAGIGAAMDELAACLGHARSAVGEPGAGITALDLTQAALGRSS